MGYLVGASSFICIPLYMVYKLVWTPGSLKQVRSGLGDPTASVRAGGGQRPPLGLARDRGAAQMVDVSSASLFTWQFNHTCRAAWKRAQRGVAQCPDHFKLYFRSCDFGWARRQRGYISLAPEAGDCPQLSLLSAHFWDGSCPLWSAAAWHSERCPGGDSFSMPCVWRRKPIAFFLCRLHPPAPRRLHSARENNTRSTGGGRVYVTCPVARWHVQGTLRLLQLPAPAPTKQWDR